ncbi:MAG: Na+/H+ antiporter NhaC family protein [Pseudomonadota bacterium]
MNQVFARGILAVVLAFCLAAPIQAQESPEITVPPLVLTGVPFEVSIKDAAGNDLEEGSTLSLMVGEDRHEAEVAGGTATFPEVLAGDSEVALLISNADGVVLGSVSTIAIPGWLSLAPALLAIIMALVFRQVIPALFLGIWIGASLAYGVAFSSLWYGLMDTVAKYMLSALNDSGHLSVILFCLLIGGMVGIISKNGGTAGIVRAVVGWASSAKRGQLTTAILGVLIFFDDYANTLIVGNTMRPVTDRLRVSREKLAYIVDSTAAPVATIALVTTWIGFEVGLIETAVSKIDGIDQSAYSIFLNSIAYSFYPLLAILFVFLVIATGRDFGPMLRAEQRARGTGAVTRPGGHAGESPEEAREREPKHDKPKRALNAVIPVLVLVIGTFVGIYVTGAEGLPPDASLHDIIGNGESYAAMIWSSLLAVVVASAMSMGQGILNLVEVVDAWYAGARSMLLAIVILVLAWTLSDVSDVLHTGDFLISVLGDTLSPAVIPALVFVLSGFTAFATGSSWGVMGIMMPLVVPLTWAVMSAGGMTSGPEGFHILYAAVASIMAGAVWGDHCSPISDTTILSSLASGCDHVDHVRTQLPYALVIGGVAMVFCILPVGFGAPWWILLPLAALVLVIALRLLGDEVEDAVETPASVAERPAE